MIEVLNPGVFSSIQDGGRKGYRHLGVPISGFMDVQSAQFTNALIGKSFDAPLIEIAQSGFEIKFHDSTNIVVSGAEVKVEINGNPVSNNRLTPVQKEDVLKVVSTKKGVWSYLGLQGKILSEQALGSYSQFKSITKKPSLQKGDILLFENSVLADIQYSKLAQPQTNFFRSNIQVYKGPEFYLLTEQQRQQLFEKSFSISSKSNRMAYLLNEPIAEHHHSILTSPVIPGTIQWTPSGELFCLMKDSQTTGGYPRILQLEEMSISHLSQKQAGEFVVFDPTS